MPPEGEKASPGAGKRLAEARRAREVSVKDVARELHLDEPKVAALEDNDFELLGAPVFARGYLRKYAELVDVPAEEVLADYQRLTHSAIAPPIVTPREKPATNPGAGLLLAGVLAVILAGGAGWWFLHGPEDPGPVIPPAGLTDDRVNPPQRTQPASAAAGQPSINEPSSSPTAAARKTDDIARIDDRPSDASPPLQEEPLPAVTVGDVEMTLRFSGDCWTEITNATGERLFFGLGNAGRSVTVAGPPPLQVLLGDSDEATLMVNGEEFVIPPSARRGDTARLTITGR